MVERGVPAVHALTPADARRCYLERRFFTQPEPPVVAEVRDLQTGDGVPLRLYRPSADGVHPVLVYFHGDSSGGNLAAVVALALRDAGDAAPLLAGDLSRLPPALVLAAGFGPAA